MNFTSLEHGLDTLAAQAWAIHERARARVAGHVRPCSSAPLAALGEAWDRRDRFARSLGTTNPPV